MNSDGFMTTRKSIIASRMIMVLIATIIFGLAISFISLEAMMITSVLGVYFCFIIGAMSSASIYNEINKWKSKKSRKFRTRFDGEVYWVEAKIGFFWVPIYYKNDWGKTFIKTFNSDFEAIEYVNSERRKYTASKVKFNA